MPPLGAMEDLEYEDEKITLMPGDKIFVYTDGVPEATNASNELFGMERTVQALNGCKDGEPADILSAEMLLSVMRSSSMT